jgi:Raf kinase inhibitor-like YbhB/YbcL family protein
MFQLTSTAFQPESKIEKRFTCSGEDISPPLSWQGAPQGTKSFALIVHDPDAPRSGGWTHWVVYNLPPSTTHLQEDVPKQEKVSGGGVQGINDSGRIGYMGPCPPSGTHRYYFRLYALDQELSLKPRAGKSDLESAMQGHILAQTELMGKFAR